MKQIEQISSKITIFSASEEEFSHYVDSKINSIFKANNRFEIMTAKRFTESNPCDQTQYLLKLLILEDKELVGFHTGYESSAGIYYMQTSAIVPQYRSKGIYSKTLSILIQHLWQEGFHKITSRHYITQNNIIVPKLKAGFLIQGFEADPRFGQLINLSLYKFDDTKIQAQYRSGQIKAPF
jgi:hypothetical protein